MANCWRQKQTFIIGSTSVHRTRAQNFQDHSEFKDLISKNRRGLPTLTRFSEFSVNQPVRVTPAIISLLASTHILLCSTW